MQINALFIKHGIIFRVLAITDSKLLIINCFENKMPYWENTEFLDAKDVITEGELLAVTKIVFPPYDIKLCGCSRNSYYKYKRELKEHNN